MSLLFDTPLIAGLRYEEDLVGDQEEQVLTDRLGGADLSPFQFHGWLGNRKTRSFGWRYDFDDASFAPTAPIPDWLQTLREKAAAFAGLRADDFVHVLLARYDPGAGIGWHRDRDVFENSSAFRFEPMLSFDFGAEPRPDLNGQIWSWPRARPISSRAHRVGTGSIASFPAASCAFRSRSGRSPKRA